MNRVPAPICIIACLNQLRYRCHREIEKQRYIYIERERKKAGEREREIEKIKREIGKEKETEL